MNNINFRANNYKNFEMAFRGKTAKNINSDIKASKSNIIEELLPGDMYGGIKSTIVSSANKPNDSKKSNFAKLRDSFSERVHEKYLPNYLASWDFYTNSTDENYKKLSEKEDALHKMYKDEKMYQKFMKIKDEEFDKLNSHEQKQLKDILQTFEEELNTGDLLKILNDTENSIAQKYNSYVPMIDGKSVSKSDIDEILDKEHDVELRKKAYDADILGGDLIADDLIKLVIKRNEFAKSKGYDNYFDYKLKEIYDVEPNKLEQLIQDIYQKSATLIRENTTKYQESLKKEFGVSELKPYHYRLITKDDPEKPVNSALKTKEQVVDIVKKTFKSMGYDLDKLEKEKKLTLDLFPRKNKNSHGFCFEVEAGKDSRILANLKNDAYSVETLLHELGHCVYNLGISQKLPRVDRYTHPAMTEAVAMMMGDLIRTEGVFSDLLSKKDLKKFQHSLKDNEITSLSGFLVDIDFEKEMYKNPTQDLKKLWKDLLVKYKNRSDNDTPNNSWATIPHFLSHPAYIQNYFRANLIKAQMYNKFVSDLGTLTNNTKTKNYLEDRLFKFGTSFEEDELIKLSTGKDLSVDAFVSRLK